ncbi:MAG: response regulator transcription factor [Ilumatobacteraceae bacterium]
MELLFVEDDARIREVLTQALEDDGFTVHVATTGEEAVAHPSATDVDLAIVDLRLPGIDGMEVVRHLRQISNSPIVILTAHGDSNDVVVGLEAGADDFLSKPISGRELVARLRAILRRSSPDESDAKFQPITMGTLVLQPSTNEFTIDGVPAKLTRTEFGVLQQLMTKSPATVSRQELLETVWGYDYLGDSRLVDMQVYRLRQKLEAHGIRDKLLTVRAVGFRFIE